MKYLVLAIALALGSRAMNSAGHKHHVDHKHKHGKSCGHKAVKHDDHIDYEHDGHLHHQIEGHTHDCEGPKMSKKKS